MVGSYDVAVVGGGIIGVTTAFFLAKRGKKVVLLERNGLAQGATGNSFAWINASSKAVESDYHHLNAQGLAGYNELAQEFGEETLGLNPCGKLSIVPTADSTRHAALREKWRLLRELEYPVAWIDSKELPNLEPSIKFDREYEALLSLTELSLDAPRFVRFMAGRVYGLGGEILENTAALSLDMDESEGIRGLESTAGPIFARKVLLAAGPGSAEQLARLTGFAGFASRFPVRRSAGLLLTTPDLSPRRLGRRIIYWEENPDLHMLHHFSGGLRMGAEDTDGMIAEIDSEEIRRSAGERLLQRARDRTIGFPEDLNVDNCGIGVGYRPMPEDGRSIADVLPGAAGLFIIVTHSGVTLAPILGRLMAEFIDSGTRPETLSPFTLNRFPGFS